MSQDQPTQPLSPPLKYANLFVEFQEAQSQQRAAYEHFLKAAPYHLLNHASAKEFEEAREALRLADINVLRLYNNVLSELQQSEEKLAEFG